MNFEKTEAWMTEDKDDLEMIEHIIKVNGTITIEESCGVTWWAPDRGNGE